MPYQNKEQAKEAARLRKQKQRERDKGVTKTPENVTCCVDYKISIVYLSMEATPGKKTSGRVTSYQ